MKPRALLFRVKEGDVPCPLLAGPPNLTPTLQTCCIVQHRLSVSSLCSAAQLAVELSTAHSSAPKSPRRPQLQPRLQCGEFLCQPCRATSTFRQPQARRPTRTPMSIPFQHAFSRYVKAYNEKENGIERSGMSWLPSVEENRTALPTSPTLCRQHRA